MDQNRTIILTMDATYIYIPSLDSGVSTKKVAHYIIRLSSLSPIHFSKSVSRSKLAL